MTAIRVFDLLTAIRKNCINCMGTTKNPGYRKLITNCTTRDCTLWPYRFGMNRRDAKKQGKDVDPNAK
jgi:hypothetical protein